MSELNLKIAKIKAVLATFDFRFEALDDLSQWSKGYSQYLSTLDLLRQIPVCELPSLLELIPEDLRFEWILDMQKIGHSKR